ncbi:MAG: sugar ABC transporter ATP-binding protein, partial [Thermomicrobiales bacterium]|nr:sugar ABC transporter ATP-binding protein [Thermomicrobiales bacterium]
KSFPGVKALAEVSLRLYPGQVTALVGENGAGKSTIMKMLAGVHQPDSGTLVLRGQPVTISNPLHARNLGVSIVFQELNLFPHLTVVGNIFANREPTVGPGLLNERQMVAATRKILDEMGVNLDPHTRVGRLSVAEKQLVEIARTLQQESDIIIMDEPNSALSAAETERLFALLRRLRDQGLTIIYVSHRLEEVFAITESISVIRDGRYQGTWRIEETSIPEIIAQMIGRRLGDAFPQREPAPPDARVALAVRNLRAGREMGPVDFEVRAGEILGFAGLEGSGVGDVFNVLFGLEKPHAGQVVYQGRSSPPRSPFDAIRQGFALIPANRRDEGLMTDWSVRRNASLAVLDKLLDHLGLIDRARERQLTNDFVRRLNVATDSIDKRVVNLSGGNQQKIVVAKWLATGPEILILNDPTRGIDVGAKSEIYALCDELARGGLALLFTSSEIEETLGVCDRILVFHRGRILREFARGEASKADVLHWIAGGGSTDVEQVDAANGEAPRLTEIGQVLQGDGSMSGRDSRVSS